MWNRWTFNAAVVFAATALSAPPPDAPTVRYAWMALAGGDTTLHAAFPADDPWDACVLTAPVPPYTDDVTGLLELANGDTLPGAMASIDDGALVWRSPRLGERRVDLADVVAIRTDGSPAPASGAALRNGDWLDAPLRLDGTGITQGELRVPWERIGAVRLRETPALAPGLRLWLRNGGVIGAEAIEPRPGGVLVRTAHGAGLYRLDEMLAITRGVLRVRELGGPDAQSEGVSAGATGLTARSPATASWELTGAARAIVGVARTPADSRKWGDALVSVWVGSDHALSTRTTPDRPVATLAAGVTGAPGETLRLSVQPGTRGGANGVVEIALAVIEEP